MEYSDKETERINAIKRYVKGERPVDIYTDIGRAKSWFYKWLKRFKTGETDWFKDLSRRPKYIPNKTRERIEEVIVNIRKSLMEGEEEYARYFCIGPEAVQFHMEQLNYPPSDIPSLSTIKRIIKRNKLLVKKKKRYKRVSSKRRYTILNPKYIDEMHQMDYVGPRHIKGYGAINSLHLRDVVGRRVAGNQYCEKSMDNVIDFLLNYWKNYPIPKYLQVDNGMCFAGDYRHPKSFCRFMRLALYVGIEVVFIAPSRPWMNGSIEGLNKLFKKLFWEKEVFVDLLDIGSKSQVFFEKQNKFNEWKLRNKDLEPIQPRQKLKKELTIGVNNLPLVTGKVHFIREVNSKGEMRVLNENFKVGKEYTGEYVWATIITRKETLILYYKDEDLKVTEIKRFSYEIPEKVRYRKHSIFVPF